MRSGEEIEGITTKVSGPRNEGPLDLIVSRILFEGNTMFGHWAVDAFFVLIAVALLALTTNAVYLLLL